MTTMCALLAGVPLMLGTGIGSEIRQPLGYAIVGGLLVSQVLTLFTTPVVYIYMDRLGHLLHAGPPSPPSCSECRGAVGRAIRNSVISGPSCASVTFQRSTPSTSMAMRDRNCG